MLRGEKTPDAIYLAVGEALSCWEAAADTLLALYRELELNSDALDAKDRIEKYIGQGYGRRSKMIKSSLKNSSGRLSENEKSIIQQKIEDLDVLASRRNEISHGHCAYIDETINGELNIQGNFLMPAWSEGEPMERTPRFQLLASDIKAFEREVRRARWTILHATSSLARRRKGATRVALIKDLRSSGKFVEDSMMDFAVNDRDAAVENMDSSFGKNYLNFDGKEAAVCTFSSRFVFSPPLPISPSR